MNSGDLAILLILSLLAHGWGDYVIQTDWMAVEKTKRWTPAILHALSYTAPFAPLLLWSLPILAGTVPPGSFWIALAVIGGTHAVIDRYRLARHVIWFKNRLGGERATWAECSKTGFPPGRPEWLTTWLMIIVDNIIHITINSLVIIWAMGSGS